MSKPAVCLVLLFGCGSAPEATSPSIVYSPCTPLSVSLVEATAQQRDGAVSAVALWNSGGVTHLSLDGDGELIAVRFKSAAELFHGFYDPGTGEVIINSTLEDPGAFAVVLAHELGHAMGLVHVDPKERASVMNPGNVSVPPTPADNAQLSSSCTSP